MVCLWVVPSADVMVDCLVDQSAAGLVAESAALWVAPLAARWVECSAGGLAGQKVGNLVPEKNIIEQLR